MQEAFLFSNVNLLHITMPGPVYYAEWWMKLSFPSFLMGEKAVLWNFITEGHTTTAGLKETL